MAKNLVKNEGALDKSLRKIINDNLADVSVCTTQFDAVTGTTGTTLTNVVGLVTGTLEPGTYRFQIDLGTVATANSGLKVGLKQSVASMLTSIEYQASAGAAAAVVNSRGTTATDAASIIASTTAIVAATITGTVVVAKAGTLQLQAAQNAAHADTTSVFTGSYMEFRKIA
jgi:hypothetical protein